MLSLNTIYIQTNCKKNLLIKKRIIFYDLNITLQNGESGEILGGICWLHPFNDQDWREEE